jgi:hypothetical protein
MSSPKPAPRWTWIVALAASLAFLALCSAVRLKRVQYVSSRAGWSQDAGAVWQPSLVVPGNLAPSFEWLDQTRLMLDTGALRIRRIDYENAPFGRDVRSASPYRWWLGLVASALHGATGKPRGAALESAALIADPLLAGLGILALAVFVARRWGPAASAATSVSSALLYPLGVAALPGAPDDALLRAFAAAASLLLLLAGASPGARARHWCAAAGVMAGFALWLDVSTGLLLAAGTGAGAVAWSWAQRGRRSAGLPVMPWAAAASVTVLAAYLVEYFPADLGSWDLHAVHPLYGIALLGWGVWVSWACGWASGGSARPGPRGALLLAAATLAVAALPVTARLIHTEVSLSANVAALRLTRLATGTAAQNLLALLTRDGLSAALVSTLLGVALLAVPAVLVARRRVSGLAALALGPALAFAVMGCVQLSAWTLADAAVVVAVAATTFELSGAPRLGRTAWWVLIAVCLAPGAILCLPRAETESTSALLDSEVVGLVDRDLARWLAARSGEGSDIVLAPPTTATALYYYGSLRGLATLDPENREGIQAAVRMVSATTFDEASNLFTRRGVTWVVLPSWDPQLDTFARLGLGNADASFVGALHHWSLPDWLRPVPYPIPSIEGFEGQMVAVFKTTDDQDEALRMSRMASYMIESERLDYAAAAAGVLKKFQTDLSALVARAEVAVARKDREELNPLIEQIVRRLSSPAEKSLPWDRRVVLAVVLAQAQKIDLARAQLKKVLEQSDYNKLRDISTGTLYHLEVLRHILSMEYPDPSLGDRALGLLPPEAAERLRGADAH